MKPHGGLRDQKDVCAIVAITPLDLSSLKFLCLRGICSAASRTGAVQPGKQQQHRFSVSLPSLYPAQEVPGIGEALAREFVFPIRLSLVGTLWFHVAATNNIM